jgi:tetratricopeptide (TPR) repeat protein
MLPAAAKAKWLEASSQHFVIYSDDQQQNLQKFSEQLERFHAAVTVLLDVPNITPSPSNRVTVYILRNDTQVRKLAGDGQKFLYAFYVPRAGQSLAIVPHVGAARGELPFSMITLLHEYTHHVTFMTSTAALPVWVVEGSAEFFASAKFEDDGAVRLGRPATHRAGELRYANNVTLQELFNPNMEKRAKRRDFDSFYGRSWLLYHYLTFSKERQGQLRNYLNLINKGVEPLDAARKAFGDFKKLDDDLDTYFNRKTLTAVRIVPADLKIGPVAIRELSPGEAAIMPIRIRSRRGVDREQALAILPEARKIATAFPRDPAVLAALAEAEHDAGNYDASIAAADASLAIEPRQVDAYVQKGYSLFAKARKADDKAAAYRAARLPFVELNKLENDHPLPLFFYYLSFVEQGQKPNAAALAGLRRAVELAPFDPELRGALAMQAIRDGNKDEAIWSLKPIAYSPHGGKGAEMAKMLIERLQKGATVDDLIKDGKLQLGGDEETPPAPEPGPKK